MAVTRARLSERQVSVLQWIADGCPAGVMAGSTYKVTAVALQNRHLVEVSKRGGTWSAKITQRGRHYLANGEYPPADKPSAGANRTGVKKPVAEAIVGSPPARSSRAKAGEKTREEAGPRTPVISPPRLAEFSPVPRLVADVLAAGGSLVVRRTEIITEETYRRLVQAVNDSGLAPAGQRLVIEPANWPELRILIVDAISGRDVAPLPKPLRCSQH